MTKRKKSSDLTRARKETKRLQRETNTRIRKATKRARKNGDDIALKKIEQLKKSHSNSLSSNKKSNLPKSFRHNVMREKGRAIQLEKLSHSSTLSKKKQKRQTTRTFEKLFGKEKTKEILGAIGGGKMNKMSNQFWEQLYAAQDMLFAMGIVPADEIMGKFGSIGSGLLETGKELVSNGFWSGISLKFENGMSSDSSISTASLKVVTNEEERKVETNELAAAIVEWYKSKYGIE